MERRLSAILAVDVVGYSRLMERDEADTFERLRAHRKDLFEPEIAAHHGRVFKLTGDGLLAEFGSVVDAVECAVTLQRGMAERNAGVDDEKRIDVRIGINLGDVIVEGEDRHGEGVNIAARLQQLAAPGGICVSRTVYNHVKNKSALGFESLGEHQVKNIAEPVSVFRVRLDGVPHRPQPRARRDLTARVAVAAVSIALLMAGAIYWVQSESVQSGPPMPDKPSIAVLPFANLGSDSQWQRFADGLTEDIITDLSRSRDLLVIARNSTEVYRDKAADIREVGRALGVRYVLEGSLQASGDRLRVTAQLIDATSGGHVWSERYDRPAQDLFAVQDEITGKIAGTLVGWQGTIAETDRAAARRKDPANLEAYDYYLLGLEQKHLFTKESQIEARKLFNKAIAIDPDFQPAIRDLGLTYSIEIDTGVAESFDEAKANYSKFAHQAIALDPNDAMSHMALAGVHMYDGEFALAARELDRALELGPNNADILILSSYNLCFVGQPERAPELAERAVRLNPHYPHWYNWGLRFGYFFAGQFDRAYEAAKAMDSDAAYDLAYLAMIAGQLGRTGDAELAAAKLRAVDPEWSVEFYAHSVGGFAREAEYDLLFESARKAGLPGCMTKAQLENHPDVKLLKACDAERASTAGG